MIVVALFLLGFAAIYVAVVEVAFSTLMRLSLRLLAERGGRTEKFGAYLDEPLLLFIPARLLLGLIFGVAGVLFVVQIGQAGLGGTGVELLAVVVFVIACEHLLPLLITRRDPERVLLFLIPSFTIVAGVVAPVTAALMRLVTLRRERLLPAQIVAEPAVEDAAAAEAYLAAGEEQGLIERDERRLLQSVFDFGATLVREVMTPRPDIVAIRADATIAQLKTLFREEQYSRMPVYRESLDDIAGVVFIKDLIRLVDVPDARPITALIRPAHFVPETKRVPDLLKEFQVRRVQLAIVVDEYGGTAGLATLEDLVEEIVGEIRDEYDVETEPIVEEGNGAYVFSGKVDVDELSERLGVTIEREGFETVGGYVLAHLGRVPVVGETFELDGLTVEVLEAERRRLNKVRISKRAAPEPAAEESEAP